MDYTLKIQLLGLAIVGGLAALLWLVFRRLPDDVVQRLFRDLD